MPTNDSPALIVARYLKANHYAESYDTFISEAGLPSDAGNISSGDLTLETLLEEKRTFDLSLRFEKLGHDSASAWNDRAPAIAHVVPTLPTASNILSVGLQTWRDGQENTAQKLFVSTADRRLHILDAWTDDLLSSRASLHDSPILSSTVLKGTYAATASMSGQLHISNADGRVLEQRRDHAKYIVKVTQYSRGDQLIVATAGWDNKINIYRPNFDSGVQLGEPTATISLPTKPEALLFLEHPDDRQPVLLVSRADSTFIYFYSADADAALLGKQNLAPHSNAWIAFTPSALAPCPTNPGLLAVATSTVPHMKLLIVRLLFPPKTADRGASGLPLPPDARTHLSRDDDGAGAGAAAQPTQASQAREALAVADREEAAIQIHCTTMAPQTAYSTPAVAWRPDGSGVWVNGDDGAVRGIEASTGKVVSTLLGGHVAGSKVRCLWAGVVPTGDNGLGEEEEVLVSGGFDQRLIVWKVE